MISPIDYYVELADKLLKSKPDTQCERHVILGWNGIATRERCARKAFNQIEDYEIQLCDKCLADWASGRLEHY